MRKTAQDKQALLALIPDIHDQQPNLFLGKGSLKFTGKPDIRQAPNRIL